MQLQLLIQSPTPEQLNAAVLVLGWLFWLGWAYVVATTVLRIMLAVAMRAANGAAWVQSFRGVSDLLTLPFIRRAVDTTMAERAPLVRVAVAVPNPSVAMAAPIATQVDQSQAPQPETVQPTQVVTPADDPEQALLSDLQPGDIVHVVRPGESLAYLAAHYVGDPQAWKQIYADNRERTQPDGRSLREAGKISPGWLLVIRNPKQLVEFDTDGRAWYTVRQGDSLWHIAEILLGDGRRWPELFAPNIGAQLGDGHILSNPDVIWAGLRLRAPALDRPVTQPDTPGPADDVAPNPGPESTPVVSTAADQADRATRPAPLPAASMTPMPIPLPVATEPHVPTAAPAAAPTPLPAPPTEAPAGESRSPLTPAEAALAAGAAAAAALAAGRLVVRRRRPAPISTEPESDVQVDDGFADADPVHYLARRLAHTADPATVIAALLGQAYMAVFDEQLTGRQHAEATHGVTVAATRHGRTSTTLVLATPVAARPHLVSCMRAAAEHAFGEHVDVDGQADQNGDVLVRVTWHPRRPLPEHLFDRLDPSRSVLASVWPTPALVPALVLHDRQDMAINWHTVRNVLIASPTGRGADAPLTALVAALASVRAPEDLGLVVVAAQHTLPKEIGLLPHGLQNVVDPGDPPSVLRALERIQCEVDRRRRAPDVAEADLVLVIRELGELEPDAQLVLGSIAAAGPDHGVELLAASDRPVAELLSRCPSLDHIGTRLVLQTAGEEESVALLGIPGAEYLGAGGSALLRLEGRLPVPGWAYRLPADRLGRLVHMMGTRTADVEMPVEQLATPEVQPPPAAEQVTDSQETTTTDQIAGVDPLELVEQLDLDVTENPASPSTSTEPRTSIRPGLTGTGSRELDRLRAAPIRIRCFGAGEVWCGERRLQLRKPELLLLFGAHPVEGIRNEALVDLLWDNPPADVAAALRKERYYLRQELRRLAPEVAGDPLPGDEAQGEKLVALDTSIASSDVHEFTELLKGVDRLEAAAAVEVYEAALCLYRGDLLDNTTVLNYRWMLDADDSVALTLRSDFQRRHKEVRQRLAELLADGPAAGLGRAEELYSGLCAENLGDERLWIALFRVHERTGSLMGLDGAVRRYRSALIELGATEVADVDDVPLPDNLERLVQQIKQCIGGGGT